jgi:hypothetical protein
MIWWLAGAGIAAGALAYKKIFGDTTCNAEEALGKLKLLLNAKTTFDRVVGVAIGAGTVKDPVFIQRAKTLVAAVDNSPVAALALQSTVPWDTATTCQIWEQAASFGQQLASMSAEFSRMTGMSPPVPEPPIPAPPAGAASRLLWTAALIGGGYLAYKILAEGEYIPRAKLPRYAGGTRKTEEA